MPSERVRVATLERLATFAVVGALAHMPLTALFYGSIQSTVWGRPEWFLGYAAEYIVARVSHGAALGRTGWIANGLALVVILVWGIALLRPVHRCPECEDPVGPIQQTCSSCGHRMWGPVP